MRRSDPFRSTHRAARLFTALALIAGLLVLVALVAVSRMNQARRGMETVFNDRVVPLRQFKAISDMYSLEIVKVAERVQDGQLGFADARARVERAMRVIDENWKAYLLTYLVEEEKGLIAELVPMRAAADADVARLLAALRAEDRSALEELLDTELHGRVEPIVAQLDRLADLQLRVARQEYDDTTRDYRITRALALGSVGVGVLLAAFMAIGNARVFRALGRSYDELERTQHQLVKRERLAALGELSAIIAHEVRNPLGVIFNSIVALRKGLKPEGDSAMLLDIVEEEADRLNRVVRDLLDFARPGEPSFAPEALDKVVTSAIDVASSAIDGGGATVRVESEPLPPFPLDARMIKQALINLVLNAIQAAPPQGRVVVHVSREVQEGRALARIDITDDGPGIPPELWERIFQPFFTTKAKGTGLGLAVVKRIVEAHQGEVEFSSTPGKGTTFTVRLPM